MIFGIVRTAAANQNAGIATVDQVSNSDNTVDAWRVTYEKIIK